MSSLPLPWLADFGFETAAGQPGSHGSPQLVTAVRCLGPRQELARRADAGEALGVDMLHAAVNELLAQHALPQSATLSVAGDPRGGFASEVVAGVLRACRGHGVSVVVPLAIPAASEQVGVSVTGQPLAAGPLAPSEGDCVLALRSNGSGDGDFVPLVDALPQRQLTMADRLANGDTIATTLLTPRSSHASVMHESLRQGWPFFGCVVDGPLVPQVQRRLPAELDIALECEGWRPGAPFAEWFATTALPQAAEWCSIGCGMLVVVAATAAAKWLEHFAAWGEPASRLGRIVRRAR